MIALLSRWKIVRMLWRKPKPRRLAVTFAIATPMKRVGYAALQMELSTGNLTLHRRLASF